MTLSDLHFEIWVENLFKKLCLISFVAILLNNLWAILEVVKTLFRHGQIIYQHQKDKISKVKLAIMQQCVLIGKKYINKDFLMLNKV